MFERLDPKTKRHYYRRGRRRRSRYTFDDDNDLPDLAMAMSGKEDVKRRKESKNVKKKSFFILLKC